MKTLFHLSILFCFITVPLKAQWYLEEDAEGLSLIGASGKTVQFDNENEGNYTDARAFQAGIAKTSFRLHGHGQGAKMLLLTHQSVKAQYHDGYKSLAMTNVEAHYVGHVSLGHIIFVGLEGGMFLAIPLSIKGETVRTSAPAFDKTYERPYFYQGFVAGGAAGIRIKSLIISVHSRLNIPFIRLYKPQPETADGTSVTPQLLRSEFYMFTITFKGRD